MGRPDRVVFQLQKVELSRKSGVVKLPYRANSRPFHPLPTEIYVRIYTNTGVKEVRFCCLVQPLR